ncbi:MAG: response regulator [Elusimicrobia bacterium]|nr:response regulator [Elusimicrobiota bacterium]
MPPKILIVDDDADLRKTLVLLLEKSFQVCEAGEGKSALEAVKRERPRLMILDECMPGMDGLAVLRAARDIDPELTVVMLTGENEMGIAMKALEMGAAMYVTKPYEAEYLREQVERLVTAGARASDGGDNPRPWRVEPSS